MARVTVEDCVEQVPNRFDLVVLAAQRARHISAGAQITLDRDNDKNPVVALREIAEQTVDLKELEDALVQTMQRHVETDEPEDDIVDGDAIRQELSGDMSMGDNDIAALAKTMSIDDGAADADEDGDMMFEDVEDAED